MTLIQSPETIMLIHRTMVSEQMQRDRLMSTSTGTSLITIIRSIIGGTLISLGQHITPSERAETNRPVSGRISVAH